MKYVKHFGDKKKFSLEYKLNPDLSEDNEILKYSWGKLSVWVDGVDICQYSFQNKKEYYEWHLMYVVEWLCENIEYILGYDPFPLPVEGDSAVNLIEKGIEFDSDDDDEFYLWHQSMSLWIFRHTWFSSRAGSNLSNIYFRRVDEKIEISWDNSIFEESNIYFEHPKGKYMVHKDEFKKIALGFIRDILAELKSKVGEDPWIENLKKGIHLD